MTKLEEKIQSFRSNIGAGYIKPDPSRLHTYRENLKESSRALDYLNITRGINKQTIDNFKLGYDIDKDAIVIPVFKHDELVNLKYRYIDPDKKPKYTQEKGCEVWVYNEDGISRGQTKGSVLITEGEFDCMSAWQAGFRNVISPASGKDSYGVWIEMLDTIPKIYIAYDNDKAGKGASLQLAERLGIDKSYEVMYPEDIKDANDFFKIHDSNKYLELIKSAKPFYKYTYQGLDSVIDLMRIKGDNRMTLNCLPYIKPHEDWVIMVSGISGAGKTSYVMNIADELISKDIPTLVLPYERGIKDVGQRFLQVNLDKTEDELYKFTDLDWSKTIEKVSEYPLYFSTPSKEEMFEIFLKAKKLFGIKVIIIDHLAYFLGGVEKNNQVAEIQSVMQGWKNFCLENNIILVIVHHIRKGDNTAVTVRKPKMEDLVGGASTFQVAEGVVMLSNPQKGQLYIDVLKNKGEMGYKLFSINEKTGRLGLELSSGEQTNPREEGLEGF